MIHELKNEELLTSEIACRRLQEYPQLTARRRLCEIQQRDYEGRYTLVVDNVREMRPLAEVD